jgi:hydroxymethylbilane synthase
LKEIIIATRASALALWQAEFVKREIEKKYPDIEVSLNKITSKGDKILDRPLALIGGKGHFTKELEDEMLAGNADIAVHSLKDVPTFIPDGLELVAITKREEQSDVFLSHKYPLLEDLPKGAVVGTTSLRRRMQLLRVRPDLKIKDLRGNVNTRLKKLANGEYDAIILAYIGVDRLNLLDEVPYHKKLPLDIMIPPMGQASLGIEIVANNKDIREIALSLNDEDTAFLTKLERDFISKIGAGCSAPVAVNATLDGDMVKIEAMIGFADGTNILHKKLQKKRTQAKNLGVELAELMIENGAIDTLKRAEELAFKDIRPDRL